MVLVTLQGYPSLAHLLRGSPKSSPCCSLQSPTPRGRGSGIGGFPQWVQVQGPSGGRGVGGGQGPLGAARCPRQTDRRTPAASRFHSCCFYVVFFRI